ncbi:ferredoxin [Actinomadura alba]|uniref:ferredoxin n=1 Tax=Actinomadura alba TaxID=406431 RepID=UPI001C9D26D3|nr:ferredoxin [Actinomadura alba]
MSEANWKVEVTGACIASGMCVGTAPAYFELDGDRNRSVPRSARPAPDPLLLSVADSCPLEAIRVHDAGGTLLAPLD